MERSFIEALLKRVRNMAHGENGFRDSVWTAILTEVKAEYAGIPVKPIIALQVKAKELAVS